MTIIRIIFGLIGLVHGLIHLMGFFKAFNLAKLEEITMEISKASGLVWLLAAVMFVATVVAFFLKFNYWWLIAAMAIMLSQMLIIFYWKEAKFGTIANVIVLVGVILSYLNNQ
jgi:hypothetical protein